MRTYSSIIIMSHSQPHLDVQHAFPVLVLDLLHRSLVPLLDPRPARGHFALGVYLEVLFYVRSFDRLFIITRTCFDFQRVLRICLVFCYEYLFCFVLFCFVLSILLYFHCEYLFYFLLVVFVFYYEYHIYEYFFCFVLYSVLFFLVFIACSFF